MPCKVTKVVSYLVCNFPMKIHYIGIIYYLNLSIEESKLRINKNRLTRDTLYLSVSELIYIDLKILFYSQNAFSYQSI